MITDGDNKRRPGRSSAKRCYLRTHNVPPFVDFHPRGLACGLWCVSRLLAFMKYRQRVAGLCVQTTCVVRLAYGRRPWSRAYRIMSSDELTNWAPKATCVSTRDASTPPVRS
ncbi:unnamed protein product [Soboliphyme baturini]|uniref:UL11 n=1 Tax=Soboliphyme baturini TaxID=241478 RepID=A0A183IL63_9BILA|nr:unnamed protein product [Soboliphyme baturini]